jgi:hypothetical protein
MFPNGGDLVSTNPVPSNRKGLDTAVAVVFRCIAGHYIYGEPALSIHCNPRPHNSLNLDPLQS